MSRIEQGRLDCVAASSRDDYEWALRSAQILHDMLVNLAQVELDFNLGFRWDDWPAILEFHHGADAGKITITMPGMGAYHGVRAEHFDESLILPV